MFGTGIQAQIPVAYAPIVPERRSSPMRNPLPTIPIVAPSCVIKENFNATLYKGDIPASLSGYFRKKDTFPVYVPELSIFGKLDCGYIQYANSARFSVLGACFTVEGPVRKITKEDWEKIKDLRLVVVGPYAKYEGVNQEDAYVPTLEELEEASEGVYPLTSLYLSLREPPKNKVLAQHKKDIAILVANAELKLLAGLSHRQELFVSKWVSEDYVWEDDEVQPEINITEVPDIKYSYMQDSTGILLLDTELQALASLAFQQTEKKERKPINDRIREVVVRTPQPMVKPPAHLCTTEMECWALLDKSTQNSILEQLSFSPGHAHLVLQELMKEKSDVYPYILLRYSKALSTLGKMMFYCLKRLRFGELCKDKTPEQASSEEELSGELKKRWQPVSEEERGELLNTISRMILKTSNIYLTLNKTISFLNQFLPFWDIPGVNFTGSICCFLSLHNTAFSEKGARFYMPTRFDIKLRDIFPDVKYHPYRFDLYPLALYFPIEGSSEYFSQYLNCKAFKQDSKIGKHITEKGVMKPEGEIDCPWACVVVQVNKTSAILLVRILPNTDCDVPVFQHEELDNTALKIYSRVKRNGTKLERQDRANGSHCWNISMSSRIPEEYASDSKLCTQYIKDYMNFYPVQLYRTREEHIWTHHVAMTRLYCKCVDGVPEFSISPDQMNSVLTNMSERYNYFAGKTTPLSILHKYKWRGFDAPVYIEKKFNLQGEYLKENLPIPVGLVTTKMSNWLTERS